MTSPSQVLDTFKLSILCNGLVAFFLSISNRYSLRWRTFQLKTRLFKVIDHKHRKILFEHVIPRMVYCFFYFYCILNFFFCKGAYVGLNLKYWLYFTHNYHREAPFALVFSYRAEFSDAVHIPWYSIEFFVSSDYLAFNTIYRMQ